MSRAVDGRLAGRMASRVGLNLGRACCQPWSSPLFRRNRQKGHQTYMKGAKIHRLLTDTRAIQTRDEVVKVDSGHRPSKVTRADRIAAGDGCELKAATAAGWARDAGVRGSRVRASDRREGSGAAESS